jgi:protein tyrosine phosphatase type 4A
MVNPAIIEYNNHVFIITDSPKTDTIEQYIDFYTNRNIKTVVRLCEPLYDCSVLQNSGINLIDIPFPDGTTPDTIIVEKWLEIIANNKENLLAIHCLSGLGRAPVLVGISLIELGMDKLETIEFIREKRHGALNIRQLKFIMNYNPRKLENQNLCKLFSCFR